MQAIPTTYRGTNFRSRLEASWAAHFDRLRLPWCYEPEGFILSDGTRYLPDFHLPTANAWAEVKGDHQQRVFKVELFASDLWRESGVKDTYDPKSPMVVMLGTPHYEVDDVMGSWKNSSPLGVMGPGKGYSVGLARCPNCTQMTIIALFQPFCRNCGHIHDDPVTAWMDSWAALAYESIDNPAWFKFLRPRIGASVTFPNQEDAQ